MMARDVRATIDAPALVRALEAAEARLARHVDHVNRLNVYPVPDGDTGTNMLHTMRSAVAAARTADGSAGAVMAAAARGALMGARGNSGVILSQVFAGLKVALADKDTLTTPDVVTAFQHARELSYQAVAKPVEGTILTAIREMAESVRGREDEELGALLDRGVAAGRAATLKTPELLPVLRQAGVVDAGAQGLVYVMEGVADLVNGRAVDTLEPSEERPEGRVPTVAYEGGRGTAAPHSGPWGYDVQFLVPSPSREVSELREEMLGYGLDDATLSCVLVVGDESLVKVHVHTDKPHEIIRIGMSAGRIADVVVENLDLMTAEHEAATGIVVSRGDVEVRPLAAVAVVSGRGLEAVSRSLGATPVAGGPTVNPSVEQLLDAIGRAPGEKVIVLPNDKNVILAAERAAAEAKKPVRVVPTRTMGQGMAALVAFDATGELDAVAAAMGEAAAAVHTLEVTRAVRGATIDGVAVREGQHFALVDGKAVAAAESVDDALVEGARRIGSAELCTIYRGEGVSEDRARAAAARLRDALGCEVEVVDGGQPHYPYIVSTE